MDKKMGVKWTAVAAQWRCRGNVVVRWRIWVVGFGDLRGWGMWEMREKWRKGCTGQEK
jgi:hypothetical protein